MLLISLVFLHCFLISVSVLLFRNISHASCFDYRAYTLGRHVRCFVLCLIAVVFFLSSSLLQSRADCQWILLQPADRPCFSATFWSNENLNHINPCFDVLQCFYRQFLLFPFVWCGSRLIHFHLSSPYKICHSACSHQCATSVSVLFSVTSYVSLSLFPFWCVFVCLVSSIYFQCPSCLATVLGCAFLYLFVAGSCNVILLPICWAVI